jgi:hypothetical protein
MGVFQGKSCGGIIIYQQVNEDFDLLSKLRGSQEILKDFRKQNENDGFQLSEDVLVMSLVSFKEVLHAGNEHKKYCAHDPIEYSMKMSDLETKLKALKELTSSPDTVYLWYRDPVFTRTATPCRLTNKSISTNTTPSNKITAFNTSRSTNTTPSNKITATRMERTPLRVRPLDLRGKLLQFEVERSTLVESALNHGELVGEEAEKLSVSEGVNYQDTEEESDLTDHTSVIDIEMITVPVVDTGNVTYSKKDLINSGAGSVTLEGVVDCQTPEHSVVNLNENRALKEVPHNLLHLRFKSASYS